MSKKTFHLISGLIWGGSNALLWSMGVEWLVIFWLSLFIWLLIDLDE